MVQQAKQPIDDWEDSQPCRLVPISNSFVPVSLVINTTQDLVGPRYRINSYTDDAVNNIK